ncbi:protein adenylyltransferase SelO, mitochondrial [[Candida] railenensis]|uniref:Selenoprotein O n=1 Tax=[Candida] railenensis TaxID=45579 RepID=A0A9P0QRJ2_9ASCO|nr:protein adenylyltransferase SelO, mitochondrial [[Candida] railenensis]
MLVKDYSTFKRLLLSKMTKKLTELPKSSSFANALPPDNKILSKEEALKNENGIINKPRVLQEGAFSWTLPEKRPEYKFLIASEVALKDLGLASSEPQNPEFQKIVSGEFYLENEDKLVSDDFPYPFPYAQAYAGWQFGQFAGQLGDGRVTNLFEVPKPDSNVSSRDRRLYEIQLKGSGKTPYSRFADGKAVIRSSIREYLISEHLNAIGIPTTRALSLTYLPKTLAQRHRAERCAIVARFAESWIRLGTFDLYRWRGDRLGIRNLSDYVIKNLFTTGSSKPQQFAQFNDLLQSKDDFFDSSKVTLGSELTIYDKMYYEIIVRNAQTTAMWQVYGFLNGVLNTDNTSVLGLSMDFGPFSIMDKFNPNYTPNSEDHEQRYGYKNTPTSIWWNLTRLGENLAELIGAGSELIDEPKFKNEGVLKKEWEDRIITRATKAIEVGGEIYKYAFTKKYVETIFNRLGLSQDIIDIKNPEIHNSELIAPLLDILQKAQCDYNKFFLILQKDASLNGISLTKSILLPDVYNESDVSDKELYEEVSNWLKVYQSYLNKSKGSRNDISSQYNPLFLPRNWILDQVIEKVEESNGEDLSYLEKLQNMCLYPYDSEKWGEELKEIEQKWLLQGDIGEDRSMLQCSCSS